ncbi:MAG: aminopeptidase P family protein [Deltaproteobacteria bacterium]|nr:aminopeptidase P family protein [Deltaproteobacteria bacterium]
MLITDMANVRYLSGFTGSNGYVLITARGAWFFTDPRYTEQARQEVKGLRLKTLKGNALLTIKDFLGRLVVSSLAFESENMSYKRWQDLKKALGPGTRLKPVAGFVEPQRRLKSPCEIALIRKAVDAADAALDKALKQIKTGVTEDFVSRVLEDAIRDEGAQGPAFEIIVASGERSAMAHARPTAKRIKKGEFLLIDMGAKFNGYHSDMTRTYVLGRPSVRQRNIYTVVKEAQLSAIQSIRPGKSARDIDAVARGFIRKAGYGRFFGHGTGHGIGLNVHESPNISPLSLDTVEQGMVFTVEPGVYVPGLGGVRIEDMVLVTKTGCEVLTNTSRRLEMLF